ncbi:MAG: hypothetical protein ACKOFF_02275 [Acidimicrobiales bacterium]
MSSVVHLARRAVGSISNRPPDVSSLGTVASLLNEAEFALWQSMPGRDQRHSLVVLDRFDKILPGADETERAAALLHDVGKTVSSLGWAMRVVATVAGSVGRRRVRRFREYHEHETIGARLLTGVSADRTVGLVAGTGAGPAADALRRADEI